MFDQLLASRAWLASWVAGVALLNYSVGLLLLGEYSKQTVLEHDGSRAQLALPTAAVMFVALLTLVANRWMRETVIGGVLVMQFATLASNVSDFLTYRALAAPHAAEGRVRYSRAFRYRSAAARLIGLTLLTVLVGLMFDSVPFFVGAAFLLATAGGWYRRGRQGAHGAEGAEGA